MIEERFKELADLVYETRSSIYHIRNAVEGLEDRISKLETMVSKISGSEIAARLEESWGTISQHEEKLKNSFESFNEKIEDSTRRFCNMVNEFKGLVSIERAEYQKRKDLVLKILEAIR